MAPTDAGAPYVLPLDGASDKRIAEMRFSNREGREAYCEPKVV
jgi:hypothetical protein